MSRILILLSLLTSYFGGDKYRILLVPHNRIYQSKVSEYLDRNYKPDTKTIIIFGTNHSDFGSPILESDGDYSVQNIIPVIRKYYPDTKIISYIFRPSRDIPGLLAFSNQIRKKYKSRNLLIIASVDFSHYTSRSEADVFDQETFQAIKKHDYNQLIGWGSEHTDCPDCLIISSIMNNKFTVASREYFEGTSYVFANFQ